MQAQVPQTSNKKEYQRPELHVYGSVQALTKSVGMSGKTDGGTVANFDKTK